MQYLNQPSHIRKLAPLYLKWAGIDTTTAALLAVWFVVMVFVPIALWTIGPSSIPYTMLAGTVAQATAVFYILAKSWGWLRTAATAVGVAFLGWAIESVGTATGLPFGEYTYTELLQPQLLHVPLLIPLAWFMMLPVCWGIAETITIRNTDQSSWKKRLFFIATAAASMTAWDLFLDPQMVQWNFWIWESPPAFSYFGIPWLNYGGWLISAAIMTIALWPLRLGKATRPMLIIFSITWFLEFFGLIFFWQLPGPAIVGGIVMGGFMVRAWQIELGTNADQASSHNDQFAPQPLNQGH